MRRTSASAGMKRVHIASIRNRFFARASATSSSASARFMVKGFSHSTPLPAFSAMRTFSACIGCGVPM
jgi:hypothetical protein